MSFIYKYIILHKEQTSPLQHHHQQEVNYSLSLYDKERKKENYNVFIKLASHLVIRILINRFDLVYVIHMQSVSHSFPMTERSFTLCPISFFLIQQYVPLS
jgi:hypothetical protein